MSLEILKKSKILYIHIGVRIYRIGIFELLAKKLGVEFFWTEEVLEKNYVSEEIQRILNSTNIKYTQANEIKKFPVDGFSWNLFKLPFLKYDIYIFTNVVSVPFLILAPLIKLFGKKIIVFDELWRYPKEVFKYKIIHPYVKILAKYFVDVVVTAGSKAKELYIKDFDYDSKKIFIAYNTTIDTKYHISDIELDRKIFNKLDKVTSKKKILFLARIIKVKGLDILIKAMQDISPAYDLIVVGEGDFLDECESLVDKLSLNDRIHFIGSCLSSESPYYYKHCELYVLPSRFLSSENIQVESWGFTINEAMALERPVVATTAVGSAYDLIVEGETGAMAEEGDVSSLAKKINFVLENNKDNIMGKKSRKHLLEICNYEENVTAYQNAILQMHDIEIRKNMRKIVAFTKYSYDGPSSRYRFYNYIECFQKHDIDLLVKPLFKKNYLFSVSKLKKISIVLYAYSVRIFILFKLLLFSRRYDLVLIEYELLPYFPAFFEYLLKKRGVNYFVDYDDAIFHRYDMNKNSIIQLFFKNKIAKVISYAKKVIVCNNYLEAYVMKYNTNIFSLPTVVLLDKYIKTLNQTIENRNDIFVIGWIGSRTTSSYILDIMPVMQKFVTKYPNVRFDLVGFDATLLTKKQIKDNHIYIIKWTEKDEIRYILDFDIGIMPLDNTPWSRGKCGFKLIQYMSCEKPVIASPVGVNTDIVQNGVNGFLVKSKNEWFDAFEKLYLSKDLRKKMSIDNFQKIKNFYNHEKNCRRYIDEINNTIGKN